MAQFERYLQQNPTDVVIVVDDLASTMAAAIVTKKQGILLAHIAAGTRSFDITMPKEINRLVIDGLSDILFTAGISNNSIANKEGAELSKVYMVGNVLIDNLRPVPDALASQTQRGYELICSQVAVIPSLARRNDMPVGAGNKPWFSGRDRFYIEPDTNSTQ